MTTSRRIPSWSAVVGFLALAAVVLLVLLRRESGGGAAQVPPTTVDAGSALDPARSHSTMKALSDRSGREAVVQLEAGAADALEVRIIVRDTGAPVAGARVRVFELPDPDEHFVEQWFLELRTKALCGHREPVLFETRSDATGRAVLPRKMDVAIWAQAPGLSGQRLITRSTREPLSIALEPDECLEVQVVDEAGSPRVQAPVVLGTVWIGEPELEVLVETITDDSGRASIPCSPGLLDMVFGGEEIFLCPGVAGSSGSAVQVSFAVRPLRPVRLVFPATGSLEVRLVDEDGVPLSLTGHGIARPMVEEENFLGEPIVPHLAWEVPVEDGRATFPFLAYGEPFQVDLRGIDTDRDPAVRWAAGFRIESMEEGEERKVDSLVYFKSPSTGNRQPTTHVVDPEGQLLAEGVVVDDLDRPVARASLTLRQDKDGWGRRGESDAEGRFSISGFPPIAGEILLEARRAGFYQRGPLSIGQGADDLVVTMERTATLEGSVLLGPRIKPRDLSFFIEASDGHSWSYTRCDWSGSFTMRVPAGHVRPHISDVDDLSLWTGPWLTVEPGEVLRPPALQDIDLRDQLRVILIEAVNEDGLPVCCTIDYETNEVTASVLACGLYRLATAAERLDVTVGGDGLRTVHLEDARGHQRIVLLPPLKVTLLLPPDRPECDGEITCHVAGRIGGEEDWLGTFDFYEGSAELSLPYPGTIELRWVYDPAGQRPMVDLNEAPILLEVPDQREPQVLYPTFPEEAYRQALEEDG